MTSLRVRPYPDQGEWTEIALEGEEAETLRNILLAALVRNDWEIEDAEEDDDAASS